MYRYDTNVELRLMDVYFYFTTLLSVKFNIESVETAYIYITTALKFFVKNKALFQTQK